MGNKSVGLKLQQLEERTDNIMAFFDSHGHVSRNKVADVQLLFKEFKEDLKSEYKCMDTIKGQASLSDVEAQFYRPAIGDAWANTRISSIPWNSQPTQRWRDVLADVGDYMRYWRSSLKNINEKI